ncbi:MAG: beta strand repeat-containing protein [Candidatus Polarisedimenticolia bacterium]
MGRLTMQARARIAMVALSGLLLGAGTSLAAEYHVSPSGSDSNAGTATAPFRTIGFAAGRLSSGDTLRVHGGIYYERPSISVSGTAAAPITIAGVAGETAVIDPGGPEFRTPGNNDWELVNAALGEWRSVKTFSSGNIYGYVLGIPGYANERVGLVPYTSSGPFRSTSEAYSSSSSFYVGPGTFRDSDSRIHIRLAKTQDMRDAEARYGEVFPVDTPDPRDYAIVISNASTTLSVRGSYLVIRNITFHQAAQTIELGSGVHDVIFDGITAWTGNNTIAVGGSGVYGITVVNSRLYGDVPRWIAWSDAKDAPAPADLWRGCSLNLESGAHDFRISYNHLRGGHDGIGVNDSEYNLVVDHNRIESFHDDCFELEGTSSVGRIEIFENYIGSCLVAIAPGQDTASFPGPLLVYRNVIVLLENPYVNRVEGINTWNGGGRYGAEYMFKHGTGSSYTTQNAHYYHNTMVMLGSGGKGINITPKYPDNGRIANNLMIMVNGVVNGAYRTGSGLVWDGDIYWKMNTVDSDRLVGSYDTVDAFNSSTGYEENGQGSVARRGTNPQFATFNPPFPDRTRTEWELPAAWERLKPSDFLLAAGSPAIGAGIDIPDHPVLGVMPDTRTSRDVGAIPFGTPASAYNIFPFVPGGPPPTGDVTLPLVSLTSPSAGALVWGPTTVSANASDNVGVAGVQFRLDGSNIGAEDTSSPYSITWDATTAPLGIHTLSAEARDAAGNRRTSSLTVTVSAPDPVPPVVAVSSPAGGSTVSGTTSVSATATDNVAVAGVQFRVDGSNLGSEDTSSPYTVSWNTTTVSGGTHTLTAVARDAAGNTTTSASVTVTVNNADTAAPSVSISAPAGGSTVSGTTSISATAADNVGVAGVQFRVDGANLGSEDTSSPWTVSWNTTTVSGGTHTLTAVARDAAGNTTTSASVTVTVNNTDTAAPSVSISAPAGGTTVLGVVPVSATASDNVGVTGVQFRVDGSNVGSEDTSQPWTISWNTTTVSNGTHTLSAVARDAAGNTALSSSVTVTVNNSDTTDPSVSISAPAGGSTVSGTTSISASATDNVGVTGVQFRVDGSNVGSEDTSQPWTISWSSTTVSNGTHTLSAVARDAAGNTTVSSPVTITVNNADTAQPTISLSAPVSGVTLSGNVPVTATATDNVGVAGVQFRVDGTAVGSEDTAAPFGVMWDTTTATNGAHTLTAVARDAAGNTRTSGSVSVTVNNADTLSPNVLITAPLGGANLSGSITVTASASDNTGVVGVQFIVDGGNAGPEDMTAPWSTTVDTTQIANGPHTLSAVARDAGGNRSIATTVNVTVSNVDRVAPTVTITTPASGVSVSGQVTLAASASDNEAVVGVQFKVDGVNVGGEITVVPYTLQWNTSGLSGSPTITAVARDAAGNRTTSAGVTVNVNSSDRTAPAAPNGVRAHGKGRKK